MGELTEKLKALTVRVTSPDGRIDGVLHSWEQSVEIAFRDDGYYTYAEDDLVHQLSRILTLLVVGRQQGRVQALELTGWRARDYSKPHWDKRKREFEAAVMEAATFGESDNEFVRIDSTALRSFSVTFADGTLDELDEEQFTAEFTSAIADLLADWRMVVSALRKEYVYERV